MKMLKPTLATLPSRAPKGVSQTIRITGSSLQKVRREKLMQNPACEVCAKVGIVTPGVYIDHITPLWMGGRESASNRQTICKPCHDAKSAEETKMRNNG